MDLFKRYFITILDSGETSCTLKDDYIQFTPDENFGSLVSCCRRYHAERPYVGDLSLATFHQERAKELVVLKTDPQTWHEPLYIDDFLYIMAFTLCHTDSPQENEPCQRFIGNHNVSFELLEKIEIQIQTLEERVNKHDDNFRVTNRKIAGVSTQQEARLITLESNQSRMQSDVADFTTKLRATEMKFGLEKRKNSHAIDEAAHAQLALESRVSKLETSAKSIKALTRVETSSLHTVLSETQARVHALENLNAEIDEKAPVEEEIPPMYIDLEPSGNPFPEDEELLEDVQPYTLSFAAEMDAMSPNPFPQDEEPLEDVQPYNLSFAAEMDAMSPRFEGNSGPKIVDISFKQGHILHPNEPCIPPPNTRDPPLTRDIHSSACCRPTNISEQIRPSPTESLTSYLPDREATLVEGAPVSPCNITNLQKLDIRPTKTTNQSVDWFEDQHSSSSLSGEMSSELQEGPACITTAQSGTTLPHDDVASAVIKEPVAAREVMQTPSTPRITTLFDCLTRPIDEMVVSGAQVLRLQEAIAAAPSGTIPYDVVREPENFSPREAREIPSTPGINPAATSIDEPVESGVQSSEGPACTFAAQGGSALPHDDIISAVAEEPAGEEPREPRQTPSTPRIDPPASLIDEVIPGAQEGLICMEDDTVLPRDITVTPSIDVSVARSSGLHDLMTANLNVSSSREATHSCVTSRIDVHAITPVQSTGGPPSVKDLHSAQGCPTNIPHPDRIRPSQTEKLESLTSYLPDREATLVEEAAVLPCNIISLQELDICPTGTTNRYVDCFEEQHSSHSLSGEMSSELQEGPACITATQSGGTTLPHNDVASALAEESVAASPRVARQTPSTPRIVPLVDPLASLIDEAVVSGTGLQEGLVCITPMQSGPALPVTSTVADYSVAVSPREVRQTLSTARIDTLAGPITVSVAQSSGLQEEPTSITTAQSSPALPQDIFCAVAVEIDAASPCQAKQSPLTSRVNPPASPIDEEVASGVQEEPMRTDNVVLPRDMVADAMTANLAITPSCEARTSCTTIRIDIQAGTIEEAGSQGVAGDMGALISTPPDPTTEPDPPDSQDLYVSGAYLDTRGVEMKPQMTYVSHTLIVWWLVMCGLALFLNQRSGGIVIKPPVSSFGDGYMISMDIYNE